MNKTKIEWVKNPDGTQGYTWNPITGCLNGCPYCYARKLANGRLKQRYLTNINVAPINLSTHPSKWAEAVNRKALTDTLDPFYPRFWEDRLYEPVNKIRRWGRQTSVLHQQRPKSIFVCDMSDLFGIGIPEEWTRKVLDRLQYASQHRFYLLTKQPQNLIKFSPFPDNCWVGVTATDSYDFINRVGLLSMTRAKIKYMSFEPLLSWDNLLNPLLQRYITLLDWVIIGAQTKPYKPPKIEWVEEIVDACNKAGIPVFLKDNLKQLFWSGEPKYWAIDNSGNLRQEMPEGR